MNVDVDIHDEPGVTEAWEAVERILGKIVHKLPRQKSGSAGASVHLFFICEESFPGRKIAKSNRIIKRANGKTGPAWEVEIFGTGKQVATAPSIHPDTGKPYRWIKPLDPHTIPLIDAEVIASIVYSEDEGHLDDGPLGLSYDEVRDFVRRLPDWKASDRKDWIDVGMGIKHELGPDGLPIFVEFSKRDIDIGWTRKPGSPAAWSSANNTNRSTTAFDTASSSPCGRSSPPCWSMAVWQNAFDRWEEEKEFAEAILKDWKAAVKATRQKGEEAPGRPAGANVPPHAARTQAHHEQRYH